jgi:hypothetical protein
MDKNAVSYLLRKYEPRRIQFIDGWTGKGAIANELARATRDYSGLSGQLAVLSDPAGVSGLCGSNEDFLIPSSCLNATVSGLISRTILNRKLIGDDDFHGAVYYPELVPFDRTYEFIDSVESYFNKVNLDAPQPQLLDSFSQGLKEVKAIALDFAVSDINLIKPGIGETTRVLLRRVPWKILVHSLVDYPYLAQIYQLAKERGVEVIEYPLRRFRACGLIRNLADC